MICAPATALTRGGWGIERTGLWRRHLRQAASPSGVFNRVIPPYLDSHHAMDKIPDLIWPEFSSRSVRQAQSSDISGARSAAHVTLGRAKRSGLGSTSTRYRPTPGAVRTLLSSQVAAALQHTPAHRLSPQPICISTPAIVRASGAEKHLARISITIEAAQISFALEMVHAACRHLLAGQSPERSKIVLLPPVASAALRIALDIQRTVNSRSFHAPVLPA